ncbi:uncharacterized protein N7477_009035 [Penicillium maclennaniae]|uniref:uncharacterized protein n=1 Tax=Penicillium maclennaniae TaxID=1343394 RepID=UPI0025400ED3|nr:uncharacterized protein N7477_009035 [Penicillium maclennaniae]KAJ5661419.1 hypothetical protein N7477_009035 [Penicillium maclennaniae]
MDVMNLLLSGRFDCFCLVSRDTARIRESGLTAYEFGERKTLKRFVAACDNFIYTENLMYHEEFVAQADRVVISQTHALSQQVQGDDHLARQLRTTVETSSDEGASVSSNE